MDAIIPRWPRSPARFSIISFLVLFVLGLGTTTEASHPQTRNILAIMRFSNATEDRRLDEFHLLLRKKLEYEMMFPGLAIKAWNASFEEMGTLDVQDTSEFRFLIHGAFSTETTSSETLCEFSVFNKLNGQVTSKRIVLRGVSIDQLADIVVLKTTGFLRRNILATLDVGSSPQGCPVLLNGVSAGLTPQEFSLEPGRYTVEINGDFLENYRIQVDLKPGDHNELHPQMTFRGYPTLRWCAVAGVVTLAAAAAYGVESDLHAAYRNIPLGSGRDEYDRRFESYRTANLVRLTFQHAALIPWTAAAFSYFVNKSLRKRIMGE